MNCLICGHEGRPIFQNIILNKYEVTYYQCPNCKLIYTESPYWLQEAYQDTFAGLDTGAIMRNIRFSMLANTLIKRFYHKEGHFLDYGGGYGVFVRMMRDLGFCFRWYDKYSTNIYAKGFEHDGEEKIELLTAFELFEHFEQPLQELETLLKYSKNIFLSTLTYQEEEGYPDKDWWYYVPNRGQHICFYHKKTFQYLATKYQLHYYQINDQVHLLTEKKVPVWKINLLFKSKLGKAYQIFEWIISRKNNLIEKDYLTMKTNIQEQQKRMEAKC